MHAVGESSVRKEELGLFASWRGIERRLNASCQLILYQTCADIDSGAPAR